MLTNHDAYERKRARFTIYTSRKVKKKPEDLLFQDSHNYRSREESRQLCDLGCSVEEKYGPYSSWKFSLRQSTNSTDDRKLKNNKNTIVTEETHRGSRDNIVEYKTAIGQFSGI